MVTDGLPKNFARFFVKTCGVPRVLTQARPSGSCRRRQRWRRWTREDQRMGDLASQCDVSPNTVAGQAMVFPVLRSISGHRERHRVTRLPGSPRGRRFLRCVRLAIASHAGGHDGRRAPACKAVSGSSTQRRAALALGQWNGERDAEFLADAPGDVPMAGQVFSHQHVAGEEPSRAPVRGLKFRDA
jgi:hypothetical protein